MSFRSDLTKLIMATGTGHMRRWYTPGLFEKYVAPLLPRQLKVLAPPPSPARNYNCFIYALGLHRSPSVLKISKGFIYSEFIHHLLKAGTLVKTRLPEPGDLILYQNPSLMGQEFTHAGVLQADGSIVSKWSWGPLVRHRKLAVPDSYGSRVTYVKKISSAMMARAYVDFRSKVG